jgi:PIN domain nuclease of toxin-antitoxin system
LSVLLDTHVWIWWLTLESPLTPAERAALDAAAERRETFLSAISLWEAQVLHAKRRLVIPAPLADWIVRAADERIVSVLPMDLAVILELDRLPASFHGDPADRMIAATARSHRLAIATHDRAIRKSRAAALWRPATTQTE